jgi:hypothetical protein
VGSGTEQNLKIVRKDHFCGISKGDLFGTEQNLKMHTRINFVASRNGTIGRVMQECCRSLGSKKVHKDHICVSVGVYLGRYYAGLLYVSRNQTFTRITFVGRLKPNRTLRRHKDHICGVSKGDLQDVHKGVVSPKRPRTERCGSKLVVSQAPAGFLNQYKSN